MVIYHKFPMDNLNIQKNRISVIQQMATFQCASMLFNKSMLRWHEANVAII